MSTSTSTVTATTPATATAPTPASATLRLVPYITSHPCCPRPDITYGTYDERTGTKLPLQSDRIGPFIELPNKPIRRIFQGDVWFVALSSNKRDKRQYMFACSGSCLETQTRLLKDFYLNCHPDNTFEYTGSYEVSLY